jgi:excisionase family DNA binding protein
MSSLPDLLTTKEAAQRLGVKPPTIRRWVNDGLLDAVRLPSGRLRFNPEVILRAMSARGGWAGAA